MAYDDAWFPRIKGDNANLSLRLCPTPSGALRRAFLAGDDTVRYTYPKICDPEYQQRLRDLDALQQEMELDKDTHPTVVSLYKGKIEEKRQYHELVRTAYRAQEATGAGFVAAQQFRQYTEAVFGAPDRDVFNYIVKKMQAELEQSAALVGTPAYERLRERFSNPVFTTVPSFPVVLFTAQETDQGVTNEPLQAGEIKRYIETVLEAHNMPDWQVLLAKRGGRFSVLANQRVISIPSDRALQARRPERQITRRRLRGLVAHEVLTHARRADAGAKSALRLLGIGLPNYLVGEEGVAALREQMALGVEDYLNQDIYFAIGLAYYLDLMRNDDIVSLRPMREVFEILHDYLTVRYGVGNRSAMQGAFNLCRQIYITSPHDSSPMVFTRPLVYLTGNIAVSSQVVENPDIETYYDLGKFDPTNQGHLTALATLEILPSVMA